VSRQAYLAGPGGFDRPADGQAAVGRDSRGEFAMTTVPETFPAFVATRDDDVIRREVTKWPREDLGEGDVTIQVQYSSVNYKDGLATVADGRVARISPLIPGIDLAGTVVDAGDSGLAEGAEVLAHGYALGVAHHGGYAQFARVPAEWVVPLEGLSPREGMIIGTAGFTAAMSVQRLEQHGVRPDDGPILVTGASGGVGSMSVDLLAGQGYQVVASSGTAEAHDWLTELGAAEVIDRIPTDSERPLEKQQWAAAIDCVGGAVLAAVLRAVSYGGIVAASGNTGGLAVATTVAPFILRAVTLAGIDSAQFDIAERRELWGRLATDLRPRALEASDEVGLEGLEQALDRILANQTRGRVLVRVDG
jgi:putative YhdH/YhfP family quinone oxidoreductase